MNRILNIIEPISPLIAMLNLILIIKTLEFVLTVVGLA